MKCNGSAGEDRVDFLRGSNLRYALTSNPTIYDSLVKQFWQTATAKTLADGTLELHATIDTIVYTITEASIRNKLQLADASGITMLPNNEIFEGMEWGIYWVLTEAAKTLSRVASQKPKSIDKGRRYKRRKETKGKKVITSLDFQEEVSTGYVEGANTGSIKVSTVSGKVSTVSRQGGSLSVAEAYRLDTLEKKKKSSKQVHLDFLLAQKTAEEEELIVVKECARKWLTRRRLCKEDATKDSLKRFSEELQTKTSKRLKSDEAKGDESTKKTGKRRKQIARKGLHSDKTDKDESEASKDTDPISGTNIHVNPIPVAMKPPSIATYKIIKQGKDGVYQIVREDGTDIVYINFGAMLKDITRDDLTELYRIVMNRYGMNGPEDELEKFTMSNRHKDWLVQEQTALGKDFSNPVDMVINPPWNLPFLGAKGLTSPEQTATGVNTPGSDENRLKLYDLMYKIVNGADTKDCWRALKNSCCKDKKRRLEVLQIKNNLKNSIYNILRKLKVFKVKIKNVLKELEVHK
ncbi:hypothetical protein Tco_0991633 [Tanacetum coccineum]|uniref:Xylulose kinase-1 n=1 Tax=Tanacetum coccineum TaxID=301880 RepID=A0ABQ5F051_9ASTR